MVAMFSDDLKTSTNAQKISLDTNQQIATLMRSFTTAPKLPSGPATGTPSMLNGKEMTVPLPDNFDISKLSNNELRNLATAAEAGVLGSELTAKLDAIATAMQAPNTESKATQQKTLETDQQIAALMRSLNTKFDDMIDHMREVVSNTDRTARGVA
jgi:hypothetical protein